MRLRLSKGPTSKIIRCTSSLEPYENAGNMKIGSNYVRLTTDSSRIGTPPSIQVTSPSGVIYYVDEFPNPDIKDALMGNTEEIQTLMATYVPPTFTEIFNSWERFGDDRHQGNGPFTGGAASWTLLDGSAYVTVDTVRTTGFVSPDKYTNYSHDVEIFCTAHHQDTIGIVMAYKNEGTTPHMLVAVRSGSSAAHGWPGYYTSPQSFCVLYHTTVSDPRGTFIPWQHGLNTGGDHIFKPIYIWQSPTYGVSATSAGTPWWDELSPTRVKVVKEGNIISATSSPYKSTTLNSASTISIDLNDYPELEWATGAVSYGYMVLSNPYASFRNVSFHSNENATDTIYNTDNGDVWKYSNGWSKIPQKIWEYLPLPTLITSTSHKTYVVDDNTLILRTL